MKPEEERAWKVHDQIVDWTGKVDAKASFLLTLESAVLAGVLALRASDTFLSELRTPASANLFALAVLLLVAGIAVAACAVAPSLRIFENLQDESKMNWIYFGHARHVKPEDMQSGLGHEMTDQLTLQIVTMSKIAWRKHALLLVSMVAGGLGFLATIASVLSN